MLQRSSCGLRALAGRLSRASPGPSGQSPTGGPARADVYGQTRPSKPCSGPPVASKSMRALESRFSRGGHGGQTRAGAPLFADPGLAHLGGQTSASTPQPADPRGQTVRGQNLLAGRLRQRGPEGCRPRRGSPRASLPGQNPAGERWRAGLGGPVRTGRPGQPRQPLARRPRRADPRGQAARAGAPSRAPATR